MGKDKRFKAPQQQVRQEAMYSLFYLKEGQCSQDAEGLKTFTGVKEVKKFVEDKGGEWRCELPFNELAQEAIRRAGSALWTMTKGYMKTMSPIDKVCVPVGENMDEETVTGIYWLLREPQRG